MSPDFLDMCATVYGEEARGDEKNIKMIGSTILNRKDYDNPIEFGTTIPEITTNGYYAKINKNVPYTQAVTNSFPDEESRNNFKKVIQIVGGLQSGKIERDKGLFFFTDKEVENQKEVGFSFEKTKKVGATKDYTVLDYIEPSVFKIQRTLFNQGYDVGDIDGKMGPITSAAIKKFQIDNKLVPDGIVGKKTKKALGL